MTDINIVESNRWLISTGPKVEIARLTIVAQDQNLTTRNYQANGSKEWIKLNIQTMRKKKHQNIYWIKSSPTSTESLNSLSLSLSLSHTHTHTRTHTHTYTHTNTHTHTHTHTHTPFVTVYGISKRNYAWKMTHLNLNSNHRITWITDMGVMVVGCSFYSQHGLVRHILIPGTNKDQSINSSEKHRGNNGLRMTIEI